jgi:Tol biopolymer transport system component
VSVAAGDTIGPFEIVGLLGAGGMGDVYRARDTRLRRPVAIKILPIEFSSDPDRQRRFEQEALAIARLNHPHIMAVYDVGVHAGLPYIVTELLEGETLRERMGGRALPERKAVEYATQIARGLIAAHDAGIVHRDLKPENLFVTKDGHIKILDFGLAKLSDAEATADPAVATVTVLGVGPVIGTAAYMSPEQARGQRADHRSDVFSFGVILYEMVSGHSPFRRDTAADTVSAILHDDPMERVPETTRDSPLHRIVRHCIEKQAADRFQGFRDLLFALEAFSTAQSGAGPVVRRRPAPVRGVAAALAMVAAVALAYAVGARRSTPLPDASRVTRLTEFMGLEESPSISPDKHSVAFTAAVGGNRQVFVRLVAGGAPLQITRDAVDHEVPRWSPDASTLMYFSPAAPGAAQGTIWEVPALGGAPRRVVESLGAGDVARDGRLAYFRLADRRIELMISSRDGSDPRVVHQASTPSYHRYPRWSPDGRWIAFQRGDGVRYDVYIVPAAGGDARQVTHDNGPIRGVAWMPDSGRLVYSSSRGSTVAYLPTLSLWEVRLDDLSVRRISPPELSYVEPDIHESGMIAAGRERMQFDLWKFPFGDDPGENVRRGERITNQTGQVQTPTIGSDEREIAFLSDSGGHSNLWVVRTDSNEQRQITHERDPAVSVGVPVWSPDGSAIAFVSSRGSTGLGFGIWTVNPDGGNLRNIVKRGLGAAWSPDGRWLYYADGGTLYKVAASGGTPVKLGNARNVIGSDGTTIYFMIERPLVDGRPEFEIHAASPETGPSRLLASFSASRVPAWQIVNPSLSPDGRWLAVPLTDGFTTNIWAVSTATGAWRQVTDFGSRATFIARRVAWSPDSRTIVAAVGEGDADIVLLEGAVRP